LKIAELYQEALDLDPTNVYAHAMWAYWILGNQGPLSEAHAHIEAALATGKERSFVRRFQLAMLRNSDDLEMEILRVLTEMRRNGEILNAESRHSLESHLYYPFKEEMLAPSSPVISADEHLATYRWLITGLERLARRKFVLARLAEQAGFRREALELYEELAKEPDFQAFTSKDQVEEGIARCRTAIDK
jgi:tetratricopeptide (TPR) repeat protein